MVYTYATFENPLFASFITPEVVDVVSYNTLTPVVSYHSGCGGVRGRRGEMETTHPCGDSLGDHW